MTRRPSNPAAVVAYVALATILATVALVVALAI